MGKKLSKIQEEIEASAIPFRQYLQLALDERILFFLDNLSLKVKVYLFSGIIRNYFLKSYLVRDIDIVINGSIKLEEILIGFEYKRNSFGGYKVIVADIGIDIWFLDKTWAFSYQTNLSFELDKYIPTTSFFNFSSIIFDYNKNKFQASIHFSRFLRDLKIDLVYTPNANHALCVVNSLYYSDKLKLGFGNRLKKHLIYLHKKLRNLNTDFDKSQLKHFGKVIYTKEIIEDRIKKLAISD